MPSENTNSPEAWYFKLLNCILEKHAITDSEWIKQIKVTYNAINELTITTLEHLEILRLFEKLLSTRDNPKRTRGPLDALNTLDLFYGSTVMTLKINGDSKSFEISDLIKFLPLDHPYSGNVKKSEALELALIQTLNWELHPQINTLAEDHARLLALLDIETLARFSASFLVLSLWGAGDDTIARQALSLVCPALGKKVEGVMKKLKELPLSYVYIQSPYIEEKLEQCVFNFLTHGEGSFALDKNLCSEIKTCLQVYFLNCKREISRREFYHLTFYYTKNETKALYFENTRRRLVAFKQSSQPFFQKDTALVFDSLVMGLCAGRLKPTWLSAALIVLTRLQNYHALSENIFILAFKDEKQTMSILNAYATIDREGWLRFINQTPALHPEVTELVLAHHKSTNFINMIHDKLNLHFDKKPPKRLELKTLNERATSTQGKQLASTLCIKFVLKKIRGIEERLEISPLILKKQYEAIAAYLVAHKNRRMGLLYAAELLRDIKFIFSKSLYLNILANPEHLQLKILIAELLHRTLIASKFPTLATKIPDLLRYIYRAMNKDTAMLEQLTAYCEYNEYIYQLSSLPLIATLICTAIDETIAADKIELDDAEKNNLQSFYFTNNIPNTRAASSPSLSPLYCMRLFSPVNSREITNIHTLVTKNKNV